MVRAVLVHAVLRLAAARRETGGVTRVSDVSFECFGLVRYLWGRYQFIQMSSEPWIWSKSRRAFFSSCLGGCNPIGSSSGRLIGYKGLVYEFDMSMSKALHGTVHIINTYYLVGMAKTKRSISRWHQKKFETWNRGPYRSQCLDTQTPSHARRWRTPGFGYM